MTNIRPLSHGLKFVLLMRLGFTFFVAIVLLGCHTLSAQIFDYYEPQQCIGPIPIELRTASSDKYADQLEQLGDQARGQSGKARDRFLLKSNFEIDELLSSGRVLFNDPLTLYVTKIKDIILAPQPALAKQVHIYVLKSPSVNAFATNDGTLVVNMGLLAHLQTEAELAFVLCHEIQHFLKKHPINNYVERENMLKHSKLLGLQSADEFDAAIKQYSRAQELEADMAGLELYLQSGYSLEAANTVFDVLDYAGYHFEHKPWDVNFFESELLHFPNHLTKQTLDPIVLDTNQNDTLSTHPSNAQRRSILEKKLHDVPNKGDAFLVGAPDFFDIRKRARFELSNLYLESHAYEACIYNSYLLLQDDPQSHYLHNCIAYALYGLATVHNQHKFRLVHVPTKSCDGEFQQLAYFFENLSRAELSIVALREVWKAHLNAPNDPQLRAIANALMDEFWREHEKTAKGLVHTKPNEIPPAILRIDAEKRNPSKEVAAVKVKPKPSKKYFSGNFQDESDPDKEDQKSAKNEAEEEADQPDSSHYYLTWSVAELMENPLFANAWETSKTQSNLKPDSVAPIASNKPRRTYFRPHQRHLDYKNAGMGLNIDKMVMVQSIYKKVDLRKKTPEQYLASEAALGKYREKLSEMAGRNNIEAIFLESKGLAEDAIDQFNDAAAIQRYLSTKLSESKQGIDLIYYDQQRIDSIIGRVGTPYFAWNGLISLTDHRDKARWPLYIFYGVLYFPTLPYFISEMARVNRSTLFITLIFDLKSGDYLLEDYRVLRAKDHRTITRATLYDIYMQINQEVK